MPLVGPETTGLTACHQLLPWYTAKLPALGASLVRPVYMYCHTNTTHWVSHGSTAFPCSTLLLAFLKAIIQPAKAGLWQSSTCSHQWVVRFHATVCKAMAPHCLQRQPRYGALQHWHAITNAARCNTITLVRCTCSFRPGKPPSCQNSL